MGSTSFHAQGFTTGNNDAGYTLTSIDIYFHNTEDGTTPTVTLHEGSPTGTLVDTLRGPANVSESETFTASSNIILDPRTSYFVVLQPNSASGVFLSVTDSDNEDATGETDWRIDDLGHYQYIQPILQPYLEWLQAKRIRVNGEIIPTNTAPTSSPGTVQATEDTAYTFAASDFNFSDADTGDTLSSVKVETLPANGSLTLSGAAVSANATVTKAQLDNGDLKYTPPADGYGNSYASFMFEVNDGAAESTGDYTMTINVMNVNDAPTGAPAIVGEPKAGVTLSLDFSGVADADGLPAVMDMEFTWAHTDNASVRLGTESTYLLSARDVGKNIYVYVEYTDAGGTAKESIEISSWPATGAIVANAAPTASPSRVDVTEDMAYTFTASDFSFSDADTGDTLSSVKIETLPLIGSLTLSGAAVSANSTVTRAQLDNGDLKYAPAADGYGHSYASFLFRVNDGAAESAIRYPMTFDIINVNDAPTGALAIVGEPKAGVTLSLDFSGVVDADGLPAVMTMLFRWAHTDNDQLGLGNQSTYLLSARDVGKNIKVFVEYEDMGSGKESIETSSWPATGTIVANATPTASNGTVQATEDMAYTFAASDFNFSDADTGDTLSSVKVETLPLIGSLTLSGAAVSAMDTVTKAQLDNGELKYTPAADGYGNPYASFMFKVNDGAVDSADAYTMTINVTNVNDAPTGAPAIVGEPEVGVTLSLDFSGVVDADGLPAVTAMDITWFHTDNPQRMIGTGSTYALVASDLGKNLYVYVEYTDLGGTQKESLEISSWPATGTIVDNTNADPTVANEIPNQEAVAGMSFSYQFPANTFNDADTSDTLGYEATKADGFELPTWLSFDAATRTFSGTPASTDTGTVSVKVLATDSSNGAISDIFDILVVPALGVTFEDVTYHVVEGNSVDVPVVLSGAPGREVTITVSAEPRFGLSSSDYTVSSLNLKFGASDTRKVVTVTATDDSDVDPGEDLLLTLPADSALPTGILNPISGTIAKTVFFTDNDFQYQASHAGGTTLSVNEQAGTLTATVRVEAPNVSGDDLGTLNENVVLSVSTADGTATAGQDYTSLSQTLTFAPSDFAAQTSGCPPPNPVFCMRADKTVTLAITDDTAYEGATAETFTLTLSHETDQRVTYPSPTGETATVSIADDERPALTFTVAPTTILENAGTATVTLATTDGTGITADTAIALSLAGTATKGTDYTISSESLTLAAGQSSVTATITATMDTASDDNETVVVTASSGGTAIGTAQTVTITETLANSAPVLDNAIPDQSAVAGTGFSYQVPADAFSDPDTGDTLSYTAMKADDTTLPTWLTFTAGTRTFTGTPAASDVETLAVKVTATDTSSATVSDEFNIVVSPDPLAHCDTTNTNELWCAAMTVGSGHLFGTNILGFDATLPFGGLTPRRFDYRTGTIRVYRLVYGSAGFEFGTINASGTTPSDGLLGTRNFTLEIGTGVGKKTFAIDNPGTDRAFLFSNHGLSWSVNEMVPVKLLLVPNNAPTVANEVPDQEAVAGTSFSYQVPADAFSDPDSDTLTYTANKADDASMLPTWLSFDAATRTFSGTPATTDLGTDSLQVTADDSNGGTANDIFDILVVPALTLSFEDFNNSDLVEGNSLDVPVLLSGAPGREVTITLFADPNRGLSGSDYTTSSLGLTFGASETRKVVTVTATDDSEVDPGERLLLALPAAADLPTGILPPSSGDIKIIQIVDNDFQYQASHAGGTTLAVNEQAGTLTATVRVEAPNVSKIELDALNENVVLSVSTADGTATAGQDYTSVSQTLTFAPSDFAAQTSGCPPPTPLFCMRADKTVTLAITDDTAYEGATAETFTLTLSHQTDQRVTYPSPAGETATVSIADNERPELTFTVAPTTILENAGTATVTLATTDGTGITADTAIALSLAGTATKGTDYTISSESLTLTAGQSSVTATITATMDTASDDNETVVVTASSGGAAIGTAQTVTITETPPTLSIAVNPASIAEAAGTSTVTVSTGTAFAADQTIALTLGGTATEISDYTIGSTSLTLTAGATSVTTTVTAVQDTVDEPDETVIVTASNGVTAIGSATVTITDDDAPGTIVANAVPTSSPSEVDVTEDMVYTFAASDFSFSDTDTGDTLSSVKVETLPALGSLTLSGAAVSAMDTVTKAQLDNGELKYTPAADGYGNDYATFLFRVNDGTADSAIRYPMDIDVMNVNDPPTGALAIVGEPTVGVTLTLDFSGVMDADGLPDKFEINWFHTDNNNRSLGIGSTYELIASDVGKNIKVFVEYEDMGGGKESIETASWPATGTIVDSNNEPTVANEIPDQEAVAGTSFSYQVPADAFSDADDDTLTYTANKADDASMLPTWLSFDAATRTFSGTPATTDLGTDSLQVTADDSNGGTANDIFDILVVPALTVSFENNTIVELAEGNSVQVPVVLSGAPGREVTITLSTSHVRGTTASDYTTSSLILTFGAAETRKVVTVTATDDSEVDIGEVLNLRFPAAADLPTGIQPSGSTSRTIYIADNDFQYQASHAGGTTLAVNEQAGMLTATVRVEAPNVAEGNLDALNENVVLSVATADGTATAGQDYTSVSQTLTFAPSDFAAQTSGCPPPNPVFCMRADKTVTLAITDDTAYEGATAETFTLTLSHETDQRVTYPSPTGETATVSIADDERPALTFTVAPTTILENAGTATVTLATTDGTGITADTAIALSLAGTATKGTDYTISSESLTLAAGQSSVTATITATMDTASDDNETVVVTASSGGAAIGTAQTVTITETLPTPTLTIAVDPASIAEAAGTSTVTVSTGTAFAADQTIALTLGGTATEISDYTIGSTSLTLTAGATSVTTTVTAVQDTVDEPDETVIVTASNGVTAIGSATVTITDDDAPGTIVANAVPTSSPSEVDVTEDMVYTFAASDFSFSDTDTGDTLSSVKVETLPALGSLTLSGAAVSAMDTVTKAQLDNGELKYTPAADGYGNDYATFLFRVNDGTADSAIRYPMDIDVMNVNDAPTGALAIVGEPTVGVTLTLDFSGVMDADGLPDKFEINWFHTDNNNRSLGIGSTYELIASDVGKNIKVFVEYEDMGGGKESIETASWPATGTIVDSNNEPTVANEIPDQEAVAGTSFSYQVPADTFNDPDDDTLTYTANKADDASMLPTWLSFDAATRTFSGTPAITDLGTDSLQVTADDSNGGTANDIFDILVVPALTLSFEDFNNSDLVEGNSLDVPVLLSGAPGREVTITLFADPNRGLSGSDYTTSSLGLTFGASETRKVVTVTATDDSEVDPGERLLLALPAAADLPTGILPPSSGDIKIIQIVDNDFQYQASHAGGTTLAVNEQAGTLTATVRVEAPNVSKIELDALNENVVLSVSTADGTATAGQDYTSVSQTLTFAPSDFAAQTSGCPPPTPLFCMRADKTVTLAITDDTAYEGATAETFTLTLSHQTDQRVTYPSPTGETATVSIADNERPALTFTVAPTTILENAGTATVTLATTDGTGITADTAIALSLAGTATKGTDYTISSESLTLTAGQSSVTATITATMDTASDDNETVVVTASSGGTAIGTAQTVTITETPPMLSIAVDPASIAEAAGTSTVTVSTGTAFTTDQTIALTLGGTATETSDYTLSDTSLTLTAGETSVTATVTAVQDTIDEPDETVIVSAANGSTAIGSATVTITDDDAAPTLTFSVSAASIAEAAGTSTLTVGTGTGSTFETVQTITLSLSGTAAETDDFTIASTSLTLAAGAGTAASSVTTVVTAVQDRIDEADETVLIDASRNSNAVGTRQTVTITDDDAPPVLSLEVSASTIAEAAGTSTVTVGTGTGSTFETDQTITLTLGGTATETSDYTIGSKSLTLPAGAGTAASEITTLITAADDDFFEGVTHEQLTLAGTQGGASFGATRSVTITENEDAPKLTLSLTDNSISENGGSTAVTASVSPRTVDAFTVSFAATPTAPATAADYGLTGTLSFAALSATPTGTVTITANNNRVDRPDKSVSVTATGSQSYFRATDAVELTIEDEDAAPAPVLQVSDASIAENAGVATVTVTTGDGSTFPDAMTVTLTMTGAAGENADYTILSKSLTLPAGSGLDISMISTTVTGVDDIIDDDAEDILVDAAIGASAVGTQQTVTIDDDDAAPVLVLTAQPASIAESGGVSTVTVGTGTGSTFADERTIELSVAGTATSGADYTISSQTLTLPAGAATEASSVTATVTGVDDIVDDDAETIVIGALLDGVAFGAEQTVTIADDEGSPLVTLVLTPPSIAEDGGVSTVTATVSPASATAFTVAVASAPVSPAEAGDFGQSGATLSFAAGAAASTGSVTISAVDNTADTPNLQVSVSGTVSSSGVSAPAVATLTILDDDTTAVLTLEVDATTIAEDGGAVTVTVTTGTGSTFDSAQAITLVLGGTATQGADYTVSATDLTLPAGSSSVTATVTGLDDGLVEGGETVLISGLQNGAAFGAEQTVTIADDDAVPAPADATLTIIDDDEASSTVTLTMTPERIDEGAAATEIEVTGALDSGARDADTVLSLLVGGGEATALPGVDYEPVADFSLTIPANETSATATFMLAPLEDRIDEADETVIVTGISITVGVGVPETVEITLADNDDAPVLAIEVDSAAIAENGGTATVTVTTGEGSTFADERTITLEVAGTAMRDEDYRLESTTVVLPAGTGTEASTAMVTVVGLDDGIAEAAETILIGGTLDGVAFGTQQTVTIEDDEGAPQVTLVLTPDSVGENGGVSTVTATVSPVSAEAFTVTVSAAAVAPAVAGDFTLAGTTLSFAADAAESTGVVTITAVDNDEAAPDKSVTVSGSVSLDGATAPADATLRIADDDGPPVMPPPVERGVEIAPTVLTIGEGDEAGGTYRVNLIAEPSANVTVTVTPPAGVGLTVSPARLTFTAADWQTAQTVRVTAGVDDDAGDRTVTLTHSATGAGYEDVSVAAVTVTVIDRIDPGQPRVSIANAQGREADGQLVFDLTLSRAADQAVSVQYATGDGTARGGEDYEAGTGTATIGVGENAAQIVVPLRMDLLSEPDETFVVTLTRAEGARLDDAHATGTIEDAAEDGAASQQWLSQFGRIAGGHVMTAIGDQIAVNRVGGTQVTVAGTRLSGEGASGAGPFGAGAASLDRFGQGGFGLAPSGGWGGVSSLSATGWDWQAQPGERPWSGDGAGSGTAGGLAGAGFGGSGGGGYGNTAGYGFGPTGTRTMTGRQLLANSAFLLNAGPGGGDGVAVWGRGNYTRFDNLGEGLQTGGEAVSATLGVDWACARCLLGIALSHTAVDATYGDSGQDFGELESTVTGLYPYFGAQLTERFSVWGLAGQGRGELIATPAADARPVQVELETGVAGLGARGELFAGDNGFSLAVKTDALVSRTSSGEAEGILEAEGEYRRVRLGLEGAWLSHLGENSTLRTSLEVAAREDAGDAQNGRGVEIGGALEFLDVAPGLSLDLAVRGLVSHEVQDYEEWGVSGGFHYDPDPGTAAGPLVSLNHAWGAPGSGGLQQALWRNDMSRAPTPSLGSQADMLSAEFAYGFKAFGAVGIPWARVGATGAGEEYRLGYSLFTHRGVPSLELGQSGFGREYRIGWEFGLRCRAQVALQLLHTADSLGERADTGFEIKFRSIPRKGASGGACETLQPLFTSGAPR